MKPTRILFLIRGLPGSGKTTLAHHLTSWAFCNDDFFVDPQTLEYKYDPAKREEAIAQCLRRADLWMKHAYDEDAPAVVAVHNTFTRLEEMEPYYELARKYAFHVNEIVCTGDFGSDHNVPAEVIEDMKVRWEWRVRWWETPPPSTPLPGKHRQRHRNKPPARDLGLEFLPAPDEPPVVGVGRTEPYTAEEIQRLTTDNTAFSEELMRIAKIDEETLRRAYQEGQSIPVPHTTCSICGSQTYLTSSGSTCDQGHGGATSVIHEPKK